jgi:TRAP-type mannitol/chloroaromatic compound transport system permease large subunit
MDWQIIIVLFGTFFVFLGLGVPISFGIAISSLLTVMLSLPFDAAIAVISQKLASGLDSFSLLAIPFFILAGNIMNQGGIALRLIEFAKVIGGQLPGSLAHVNVLANMMFAPFQGQQSPLQPQSAAPCHRCKRKKGTIRRIPRRSTSPLARQVCLSRPAILLLSIH